MHIPKCAGVSISTALQWSFPKGNVAGRYFDAYIFCHFSKFDQLSESVRSRTILEDSALDDVAGEPIIAGHIPLRKLLRLTSPSNIATVLREPRVRLVSMYTFTRLTTELDEREWGPYRHEVLEAEGSSIEKLLCDRRVAPMYDNVICRLALHGDPSISDTEFIAPENVEGIAEAALEALRRLGYVGVLEWDDVWGDLSSFFGARLRELRRNVSGEDGVREGALPIPHFEMEELLDLIDRRSAADRLVYQALLEQKCGSEDRARRIADAAFAKGWIRFGDLMGKSATKLTQSTVAP